jgi:hypothetical protein
MTVTLEQIGDLVLVRIDGGFVTALTDGEVEALGRALGRRRPVRRPEHLNRQRTPRREQP